jgi:hypothetical protein
MLILEHRHIIHTQCSQTTHGDSLDHWSVYIEPIGRITIH